MKNTPLALLLTFMLLPGLSMAQSSQTPPPKAPASWITFQQQENVKRQEFFKQMSAERDAFLSANPDAKSYLDQMKAFNQARVAAWRAAHQRKPITLGTTPAVSTP